MIEKIIEIQSAGLHLSLFRGFLVIKNHDQERKLALSDITTLLISGYGQTISTKLIEALIDHGVMVVFCGENFHPKSILLPLAPHHQSHQRFKSQISASLPFNKNSWQEVVKAKIAFQAEVLGHFTEDDDGLKKFSQKVKSGDPDNLEAQAAKRYWGKLFSDGFKRGDDLDPRNGALNYGYTVLRSCVARWVCSLGLNPMLGIHHINLENPYCLVDDLMEPFRPIIDARVRMMSDTTDLELDGLTPQTKKMLIETLNERLDCDDSWRTVSQAIAQLVRSYIGSLESKKVQLDFPISVLSQEHHARTKRA